MREMKDSGIEWIGQIPVNWKIVPFMIFLDNIVNAIVDGPFGSDMKNEEYVDDGVPVIQLGAIKECWMDFSKMHFITNEKADTLKRHNAYPKDIAIAKMMPAGKACEIPDTYTRYVVSADVIKASISNEYIRKYIIYALNSCATVQAEIESQGSTRSRVNIEKVKRFKLPCPVQDDIKQIIIYLDKKCAEIDSAISDIQSQIEALEEYKRSVITEAVTKGLDPDVELRDSGVQWIGKMPVHWDCQRGKYILRYVQKPVRDDDGVITCFRDGEVTLRSNRREEGFTIADKEIGYQGIDVGDLVVHGMDGFAGAIGISGSRGKASPVLNVLDTEQNKRYIMYYLRSMAYNDVFVALATGIRVRSCDLRWNKLAELLYPLPPVEEQKAIVEHIDSVLERTNAIIAEKKQQIETIEEYKKSLIFEYVTGKKEI